MPWVRFDDTFPIHRKVDGLTDAAFRLHVSAIFWCARNLTDGFVPEVDLELVSARVRTPSRFAAELVGRELWVERPEGWEIKDYLDYQPSKEKVVEERQKSADRQRKWRESMRNGVSNAGTNGVSNRSPSRPLPKGRRGAAPGKPEPGPRRMADWCRECDPETRMVEVDASTLAYCPSCHPQRSAS